MRNKTIQYGIDSQTGLVWSRVDSEVAVPILDYAGMKPENNFQTYYCLEKMDVLSSLPSINNVKWTRKISLRIKNNHREFWGMKPLNREPFEYEKE